MDRNRSCSDAELSESYGSAEEGHTPRSVRERGGKAAKKFQFDLEADFPSLSQAPSKLLAAGAANGRTGPIISQSRPIAITQGFATADQTGSSLENNGQGDNGGASGGAALKRRRKRFSSQRAGGLNLVRRLSFRPSFNLVLIFFHFSSIRTGGDVVRDVARRDVSSCRQHGCRKAVAQSGQDAHSVSADDRRELRR